MRAPPPPRALRNAQIEPQRTVPRTTVRKGQVKTQRTARGRRGGFQETRSGAVSEEGHRPRQSSPSSQQPLRSRHGRSGAVQGPGNRRALTEISFTAFSKNIPCTHLKAWQSPTCKLTLQVNPQGCVTMSVQGCVMLVSQKFWKPPRCPPAVERVRAYRDCLEVRRTHPSKGFKVAVCVLPASSNSTVDLYTDENVPPQFLKWVDFYMFLYIYTYV